MSLQTAKELSCDGVDCYVWIRLVTGFLQDQWKDLQKEGWTRSKGKHYCPDCSKLKSVKEK